MIALQIVYVVSAFLLALLGFNAIILSTVYLLHRSESRSAPPLAILPKVVIQLPIYNERYVVERLIEAVCKLDYPCKCLEIQLLDDSTDDTAGIAAAAVDALKTQGFSIEHIRRESRVGYKAGALEYGLQRTDAAFVVIFDADFVPNPDFLHKVMPYFSDPEIGMVQTRWAHLNAEYSLLTRAQALALDAHFIVEQTARNRGGLLMNFAGTAGIWRRQCIESSGGWQMDTLSEDIDLSYRAQLGGWKCLYLPDVEAPAEVPPLMMAFKRQQGRWATGTVQCLKKLSKQILFSHLSVAQKFEAMLHLGGYFVHPLMLLVLLLTLPLLWFNKLNGLPLAGLGLAMIGMPVQILISQQRLYGNWGSRFAALPILILVGLGITVSNTQAVLRGLSPKPVSFARTPKFQILARDQWWNSSPYVLPIDSTTWVELAFAVYALIAFVLGVYRHSPATVFMGLYALGFLVVALTSIWQAQVSHLARTVRRKWSFSGSGSD